MSIPLFNACDHDAEGCLFNRWVTERDARTGVPKRGIMKLHYDTDIDIAGVTSVDRAVESAMGAAAVHGASRGHAVRTPAQIKWAVEALLTAKRTLTRGTLFAIRAGKEVTWIARITGEYRYDNETHWGFHKWEYEIVRPATAADQPAAWPQRPIAFYRTPSFMPAIAAAAP